MAIASVAGAGPNSSAEAMKNVSETERRAAIAGHLERERPGEDASTANSIHSQRMRRRRQLREADTRRRPRPARRSTSRRRHRAGERHCGTSGHCGVAGVVSPQMI